MHILLHNIVYDSLLDDDGADIKPDMETITPQQKIQISTNDDDDDDQ